MVPIKKKTCASPAFPTWICETKFQRIPPSTSFKKPKPNKHPLPSFIGETSARQQDSFSRKLPKNQVFFIYSHSCFPLESCETPATLKKNQTTEMGAISAPAPKTIGRRQPQYLHMSGSTDSSEWTHWTRAGELEFHGVQP